MEYITIKRYKRDDASGQWNIPYGTAVVESDGQLYFDGRRICGAHSAVVREHFTRNDDGDGLKRGQICKAIIDTLKPRSGETRGEWDKRWKCVWEDRVCEKYHKDHCENMFLWNIDFFNAPLLDLYHIAALVGAANVKGVTA